MRVATSAPARIDLAGGTIDIWPLYLYHDYAQTLNAAISLRARCEICPRLDSRIRLISQDTGTSIEAEHWSALDDSPPFGLLSRIVRHFKAEGLDLLTQSDSPLGAGLAGSSALNVAVCAAIARWQQRDLGPEALLDVARDVEAQAIQVPTGLQDYRPALYGGIAALELAVGAVRRVPLDVTPQDLEKRIVLAYTGVSRNSGINNWDIFKRHLNGDQSVRELFDRIRDTAQTMRTALEQGDWSEVGRELATEWEHRKQLAPGVTTPAIDDLIVAARRAGALGAKLCGAGGGGCLIAFGAPEHRAAIETAVASAGATLLDYTIDVEGLRLSETRVHPPSETE